VVSTLLLETGPDGGVAKLELATAAGLLTLHPEGSALHGNVVRPSGIEHVTLPWHDDAILLVAGSAETAAAAARQLESRVGVGEGRTLVGTSVGVELLVTPTTFRVARVSGQRWRFLAADTGAGIVVDLDDDGIPVLSDAAGWPLEIGHDR